MYTNIEVFLVYQCILTSSVFRFHDAITIVTQNWVGKIHDVFTRANSVRNSQWWPKIGWEKVMMCSRGSPRDLLLLPGLDYLVLTK